MGRITEKFFDVILFLGIGMVSLLLFGCYWEGEYENRCAEAVLEAFLQQTSIQGGFSAEEFEILLNDIQRIDRELSVELEVTKQHMEPCYALLTKERISDYYIGRNVRKTKEMIPAELVETEENTDQMKLQTDTNASILAEGKTQYLPLPEENMEYGVFAVRPEQWVYEGEELITLCLVTSDEGYYYVEAEPICADRSGKIKLRLYIGSELYEPEVNVRCEPRTKRCENGHVITNTRERIAQEQNGECVECPLCRKTPVKVTAEIVQAVYPVGSPLERILPEAEVVFLDGHTEVIRPGDIGWQDDYDENYCGFQTVTIMYYSATTVVTIVTEGAMCKNCKETCGVRSFTDYQEFPYCASCMSEVPLFTGEVFLEEQKMGYAGLVAQMDSAGNVSLEKGDFITGIVKKNNKVQSIRYSAINNTWNMEGE